MAEQSFPQWWPWWLNQNDFFSLTAGGIGTAYSIGAYNQSAYIGNVQMRQAQLYQKKNYHLSWVAIARDDIRSMMNLSVLRINNYMVIATLLLGIASTYLMTPIVGQDDVDSFIVNSTNVSIAVSVMYFAVAIMLSVQGQNSAFSNTVRLLTWEVRPENPAKYDHNYMGQAQRVETLRSFFRWPGTRPSYAPLPDDDADANGPPAGNGGATSSITNTGLEHVEPPTRELFYLARFGRFMQLWQPLDSNAKYCIGLGLSSMSQAAAYWSLGTLTGAKGDSNALLGAQFVVIFVYLSCLVLHANLPPNACRRGIAYAVFASGPFFAILAVSTKDTGLPRIFIPLVSTSHAILYLGVLFVSRRGEASPILRHVKEHVNVYTYGLHGEDFDRYTVRPGENLAWDGSMAASDATPGSNISKGSHAELDELANADKDEDGMTADEVEKDVSGVMRMTLWVAASVWIAITFASLLREFYLRPAGVETIQDVFRLHFYHSAHLTPVKLDMQWPTAALSPRSMTCLHGHVFMATRFSVFHLDLIKREAEFQPCPPTSTYADIAIRCSSPSMCELLALSDAWASSHRKEQHLLNCHSGETERVFRRGAGVVQRFQIDPFIQRQGYGLQNITDSRTVVGYSYLPDPTKGWNPRVEIATALKAVDIDSNGSHAFYFLDHAVHSVSLTSGEEQTWDVPRNVNGKIVCGCKFNSTGFLALTDSKPAALLYLANSACRLSSPLSALALLLLAASAPAS